MALAVVVELPTLLELETGTLDADELFLIELVTGIGIIGVTLGVVVVIFFFVDVVDEGIIIEPISEVGTAVAVGCVLVIPDCVGAGCGIVLETAAHSDEA